MKKFIATLFIINSLFLTNVFAEEYKVRYKNDTGEIVTWGAVVEMQNNPGESILPTNAQIDNIKNYLVKHNQVVEKTAQEKQADKDKEAQEKLDRKTRKKALMTKLNITKSDLKALLELVQDGNDD